ncbi:stage II sporulation protein M [Halovulum sp. GXIMD14793]
MTTAAPPQIRSARFRAERESDWRRLEALVDKTERYGIRSLGFAEAQDLATLYRQALNSLSLARAISLDKGLLEYLDALCARAYLAVYAPQKALSGLIGKLILRGIPQAARRSLPLILLAFVIMLTGAAAGYLLFVDDPTWYNTLMPPELGQGRGLTSTRGELRSVLTGGDDAPMESLTAFASFLFSHNTQIAILIFSFGVLACLPSVVLTFFNGLILGAFVALHVDRNLGYELAGWLSIHGVTELSALVIACAGGLQLGFAVLFPGEMPRSDALRQRGRDAVKLALLAALMLVVAAILEGYFRQTVQDTETRLIIGWSVGLFWLVYLGVLGRGKAPS